MAQQLASDFPIDPQVTSGTQLASILNRFEHATQSTNAGGTQPADTYPGMLWLDTSTVANGVLKLRDAGNLNWQVIFDSSNPGSGGGGGGGTGMWVGDTPPTDTENYPQWWNSTDGILYVWYDDGTSAQWVPSVPTAAGNYVSKDGDTMSGGLKITAPGDYPATGFYQLALAPSSAASAVVSTFPNGASAGSFWNAYSAAFPSDKTKIRWQMAMGDATPESGSDAGSNFYLTRFTDAGAGRAVLSVYRNTGTMVFGPGGGRSTYGDTTDSAVLQLSKTASGQNSMVVGTKAGAGRWTMFLGNGIAESGGNVGSDFGIVRHGDDGTALDTPLSITRSNGIVSISNGLRMTADGGYALWADATYRYLSFGSGWQWRWNGGNGTLEWIGSQGGYIAIAPDGAFSTRLGITAGSTITANAGDLRAPAGHVRFSGLAYGNSYAGGLYIETSGPDGSNIQAYLLRANPAWNEVLLRAYHQPGAWAGFQFLGYGSPIEFMFGAPGTYGGIRAASFNTASDERDKTNVEPLPQQREAYMAIAPIKWNWPTPPPPTEQNPGAAYVDLRDRYGFSAQNLAGAVPVAVTGEVAGVREVGTPPASVDPMPILALTVLEVQALIDELASVRTRLDALEAAP